MTLKANKDIYSKSLPLDTPIFHKPFYLDAVTGGKWDVILKTDNHGKLLAAMPFSYSDKEYKIIRQPPLSIYLGPYFSKLNPPLSLSKQMKLLEEMEKELPPYDYYNQNWHPTVRNWLPFYWVGFLQSTRYSYLIRKDQSQVNDGYNGDVKRVLNKIKMTNEVRIIEANDTLQLWSIINKAFEIKDQKNPYDLTILNSVWRVCREQECCKIFLAVDASALIHAAIFLIWDHGSVYYLAGGNDSRYKTGAMTLLIDHSIKMAMQMNKDFDFEGSMIQSIEKYFRSFGAEQKEYFVLTKVNSNFLRLRFALAKLYSGFAPF